MIGKVITHLLKDLVSIPKGNIYPYVINENTPLPAIVYTIDSLVPEYTKDGWVGDDCSFSIVSFSDDYAILQDIVTEIRNALELESGTNEDVTIQRIYLTGQSEGYNIIENVFLNKLSFSTVIIGY